MSKIILTWQEDTIQRQQIIQEQQITKHHGTFRIGRDPSKCDLVLTNPTVSGLHVEIFFNISKKKFILRNLRGNSNPPIVNNQKIFHYGEIEINLGTVIKLGNLSLQVSGVEISENQGIISTIVAPPVNNPNIQSNPVNPTYNKSKTPSTIPPTYGLKCPACGHISNYEKLDFGCQWCGASLASANSILIVPQNKKQ